MDTKQFIIDERKKGTPDDVIVSKLKSLNVPELSTELNKERGFMGNILPTATGLAGGIIGGAAGSPLAGIGAVPGAVAGAALGQAAGELAQQGLEQAFGSRKDLSGGQIAGAGATGAFQELGGRVIGAGASLLNKYAISPLVAGAREPAIKLISKLSGYADDVVKSALERTPGVAQGFKQGEEALGAIIKNSAKKIGELSGKLSTEFGKGLDEIAKTIPYGKPGSTSHALNIKEVGNFIDSAKKFLRENRIGISGGKLIFDRPVESGKASSRIISSAEKSQIQSAYNELLKLTKNSTVKNVEAVLENIRSLKKFETTTGPQTSLIINELMDQAEKFTSKVYPALAELRSKYGPQKELLNEAKYLFGKNSNPTAQELSMAKRRLMSIFNVGRSEEKRIASQFSANIKTDIPGTVAGTLIKTGKEPVLSSTIPTPRGVLSKIVEALPRSAVKSYIETGKITGSLTSNPIVRKVSSALGVSTEALIREIISSQQDYKNQ
jgi:hypothetical protein